MFLGRAKPTSGLGKSGRHLLLLLLATARKLPPGQDRHNAFQEIARFRARITGLQRFDLRSAHRGPKAKGK